MITQWLWRENPVFKSVKKEKKKNKQTLMHLWLYPKVEAVKEEEHTEEQTTHSSEMRTLKWRCSCMLFEVLVQSISITRICYESMSSQITCHDSGWARAHEDYKYVTEMTRANFSTMCVCVCDVKAAYSFVFATAQIDTRFTFIWMSHLWFASHSLLHREHK